MKTIFIEIDQWSNSLSKLPLQSQYPVKKGNLLEVTLCRIWMTHTFTTFSWYVILSLLYVSNVVLLLRKEKSSTRTTRCFSFLEHALRSWRGASTLYRKHFPTNAYCLLFLTVCSVHEPSLIFLVLGVRSSDTPDTDGTRPSFWPYLPPLASVGITYKFH